VRSLPRTAAALAALALLAGASAALPPGLGVGDRAPMPVAKETVGIPAWSPKDAEGKIVFMEIFRTW
jgi:hypothetical protein